MSSPLIVRNRLLRILHPLLSLSYCLVQPCFGKGGSGGGERFDEIKFKGKERRREVD